MAQSQSLLRLAPGPEGSRSESFAGPKQPGGVLSGVKAKRIARL